MSAAIKYKLGPLQRFSVHFLYYFLLVITDTIMIAAKVFTASSPALKALRAQSTFNAVRISSVGLGRSYASQRTFGPSLQQTFQQRRNFTPSSRGLSKTEKDVFLAPADKDTPQIAKTETSWPHPMYVFQLQEPD